MKLKTHILELDNFEDQGLLWVILLKMWYSAESVNWLHSIKNTET